MVRPRVDPHLLGKLSVGAGLIDRRFLRTIAVQTRGHRIVFEHRTVDHDIGEIVARDDRKLLGHFNVGLGFVDDAVAVRADDYAVIDEG